MAFATNTKAALARLRNFAVKRANVYAVPLPEQARWTQTILADLVAHQAEEIEEWRAQWRALNTHWLGIPEEYSTEQAIEKLQATIKDQAEEIDRLRKGLIVKQGAVEMLDRMDDEQSAEIERLRADAARYQWVRNCPPYSCNMPEKFDALIDEAIARDKTP